MGLRVMDEHRNNLGGASGYWIQVRIPRRDLHRAVEYLKCTGSLSFDGRPERPPRGRMPSVAGSL